MASADDFIDEVGAIVGRLTDLGFEPVLVGGMALVLIGSERVTRDFDFVIARPGASLDKLIDVLYDRGLELVSRLNEQRQVVSTISNRRVAILRLRIDAPASAYFFNPTTELRIDLLFDFPLAAATLAERATRTKIRSHVIYVASEEDLLRLKKMAQARRSLASDAVDIAFLEARRQHHAQ